MPRSKCPDHSLLQAHVDGTLFWRDMPVIAQHLESCERCTAIVAKLRQRGQTASSTSFGPRVVLAVLVAIVAGGAAAGWFLWPGWSEVLPKPAATPAPLAAPTPSPAVESPAPTVATVPVPNPAPIVAPTPAPKAAPKPAPKAEPKAKAATPPAKPAAPVADVAKPTDVVPSGGVILRGTRRSTRSVIWRARDLTIEHSTDGGMTWATEYTADRPIRAGAFVSADVAWLVGDSGLVLRRTKNGWFGATPPAEGNIKNIRASSPSKATVTFEDGSVFTTENGGVTWSSK